MERFTFHSNFWRENFKGKLEKKIFIPLSEILNTRLIQPVVSFLCHEIWREKNLVCEIFYILLIYLLEKINIRVPIPRFFERLHQKIKF